MAVKNTKISGVSFIVPTWNKKELVTTCITLLDKYLSSEQSSIKKEIIVVENASSDGTYSALKKLKTKIPLVILKQDTNLGFSKAINLAANRAKYDYLYLINNDMEPEPLFFKNIVNYANTLVDKDINFFAISSQIFFHNPKVIRQESGKTYTQFNLGKLSVAHATSQSLLTNNSLTSYGGGGSSLINKEIFNLLGQYDSNVYTPLYAEDLDLSFVAWKKGYPSFFCPSSKVIHHHQSSSKLLPIKPEYYINKNYLAFCLKNLDSLSLILKLKIFLPLYLIKDPDYWSYLFINLKNLPAIISSRKRLSKIPNVYKDTDLIDFINFEIKYGEKYKT